MPISGRKNQQGKQGINITKQQQALEADTIGKSPTTIENCKKSRSKHCLSVHVRRNLHFLKQLARCRKQPERCSKLLESAGPEQLLCLVECCLNLLRGRVQINRRRLEALRPHAAQIRALSRSRSAQSVRKQLTTDINLPEGKGEGQTGRGIPLIPLVVGSLLPIIIEKAVNKFSDQVS